MLAASAWTIYVSWAYRSQTLAGLSLFMGFWVAVAATTLSDAFTPVMLFFLAMMGVEFLLLLNWPLLFALAILGVYGVELWWDMTGVKSWTPEMIFWIEMGFLTLYYVIFMAGESIHRLRPKKDSIETSLETFAPPVASGILNAVLFFILGSYAFSNPEGFWDHLHYFYWPLGLFLFSQGLFFHRREGELRPETSVLYVFSCGLVTLGFASAFDGMTLGNILALEGLCLFALHRMTGLSFILVLRAIVYVLAYLQFNIAAFEYAAPENDWSSLLGGLPAVLFLFAPAILMPLWPLRSEDSYEEKRNKLTEVLYAHIHAIFAGLMLVRLAAETLRPETVYAAWILLIPLGIAAAVAFSRFPALGTLAGTFFVFGQMYFFYLWEEIKSDSTWWMLPASIILTIYYFFALVFLEKAVRRRDDKPEFISLETAMVLLACSVLFSVIDAAFLINLRIDPPFDYPFALGIALVLLAVSAYMRFEFPVLSGLALLLIGSLFLFYNCATRTGDISVHFFGWSLAGVFMTLAFNRLLYRQGGRIAEWEHLRKQRIPLTVTLATTITLVLLVLVHNTSWIQKEYETVALTAIALLLFGLGAAFRSSVYRRFGLGVFLIALARVYLVDLSKLATVYKVIAFMILGAVLMGVSYLYARYREQFQKWM